MIRRILKSRSGSPRDGRIAASSFFRLLGLFVVLVAAFLALTTTPARAAHILSPTPIGEPCAAQLCTGAHLANPVAVAVNEATGDVYVLDQGNATEPTGRVVRFSSAGGFLGEFDGGPTYVKEPGVTEPTTEAGHGGGAEEIDTGRLDYSGKAATPANRQVSGIAVDNGCHLREVELGHAITVGECEAFDPSYGDVYVVDAGGDEPGGAAEPAKNPVIDKFGPDGAYIGQIARNFDPSEEEGNGEFGALGFRGLFGVSVDPSGQVWVEEQNFGSAPKKAAHYDNHLPNARLGAVSTDQTGEGRPVSAEAAPGLAVDSGDNLYVHNTFPAPPRLAKFSSTGELISREVDDEAPTGVAVELPGDDVYVDHGGLIRRLHSNLSPVEELAVPGDGGAGIAVDATATAEGSTLYLADPTAGIVRVYPPEPPGPPTIEPGSTTSTAVDSSSAVLEGEVNPRSEPGEASTAWFFEYGACSSILTCAGAPWEGVIPLPAGSLAPGFEAQPVAATLSGLAPATVYHYRLRALNSRSPEPTPGHPEPTIGEERVLTTQAASGGSGLPDHRGYEMVSPPDKRGAVLQAIADAGVIQAAADGDAFTTLANAPTEAEPQGFAETVQILSRRGAGSWESEDISTPHEATVGYSQRVEYPFFSEGLESAIVDPSGPFTQAISPQASERTPYLRTNFPAADLAHTCHSGCNRPLVSGCPEVGEPCPAAVQEVANVPAGSKFGGAGERDSKIHFLGASADARHLVLSSVPLLSEEAPGSEGGGASLYEWSAGELSLLSILPGGQAAKPSSEPDLGSVHELGARIARHAISADGNRVIFSESAGARHLYLRDMTVAAGQGETVQLDEVQGGTGAGAVEPIFQDASADGSRVFFTDTQRLTADSGASGNAVAPEPDLYECHIEEEGELHCDLTDLTPPVSGEPADVLGVIAGASADGSFVYFVANGVLTSETSARGETAVPGDCEPNLDQNPTESQLAAQRCNLYVRSNGQTKLIAVLSGADFPDWSLRKGYGLRSLSDRVSPNGRYLAFMSRRSLTGYDNRDAQSGKPDQEVFLYDSAADGGQGGLICGSCDPSGARPHGVPYKQINTFEGGLAGGYEMWPAGAWIAGIIPGWTSNGASVQGSALHQSRYLSNQGRLYFNSADALVPADSNGAVDVYQYEPPAGPGEPASDTCATDSATYVPASGGCVDLISDGTSKGESAFLDASESGDDVFFLTSARLSGRDEDSALDIYDARSGGGEVEAVKPVECTGDACQQPAVPPNDQTPGSLTFNGAGNLKECAKGKQLKKGKCLKRKAKKHKKKKGKGHKKGKKHKGGKKK